MGCSHPAPVINPSMPQSYRRNPQAVKQLDDFVWLLRPYPPELESVEVKSALNPHAHHHNRNGRQKQANELGEGCHPTRAQ